MTDFIPFGTPPGSTGNPKSIIADEFQVGQKIKVKATATADDVTKDDLVDIAIIDALQVNMFISGQDTFTFSDEVNTPLTDSREIHSVITVDARASLGHPGRTQGPGGPDDTSGFVDPTVGNKLTTKVDFPDPEVVGYDSLVGLEAHARSAARGTVARVIARNYPNDIILYLWGFGTTIIPSKGYLDRYSFIENMLDQNGDSWTQTDVNTFLENNNASQPQLAPTYSIIQRDWTNDVGTQDRRANPFAPRLYFHEDDSLEDMYDFNGVPYQTTWRITSENYYGSGVTKVNPSDPTNIIDDPANPSRVGWYPGRHIVQNLGADEITDETSLNTQAHVTAYPTHTPWMENGIAHSKKWIEFFIDEWKALQSELPQVGDPVKIILNTDPGFSPSVLTFPAEINFGLMQKDSRWTTEPVSGFGTRTMEDIVNNTSSGDFNLAPSLSDATTGGTPILQSHRCADWTWSNNAGSCHGQAFEISYSTFDLGDVSRTMSFPYNRFSNSWVMKNANNPWWSSNSWHVPKVRDFYRYDFVNFSSWFSQILDVANQVAEQRAIRDTFRVEFPNIDVVNYAYVSSSGREALVPKFTQAFTGSGRDDSENDYEVFLRTFFCGGISSPVLYATPPEEWNGTVDDYQRRLEYWEYVLNNIANTNTSTAVLLESTISPYGLGENDLQYSPGVNSIMPWIKCPDLNGTPDDNTVLGDTKQTTADMLSMVYANQVKQVAGWPSASVQPQRNDTEAESGDPTTNIFGAYDLAFYQ